MIKRNEARNAATLCADMIKKAGFSLSRFEIDTIEVTDFGLNDFRSEGAQIATLVSSARVGLKVICLMSGQTLPEHWHTASEGYEGKEETLRVLCGTLRLYLPGENTIVEGFIPKGKVSSYTSRNERIMRRNDQITLFPGTKHWLQGGLDGTVVLSISSMATCSSDPFTDSDIVRMPTIYDEEAGTI